MSAGPYKLAMQAPSTCSEAAINTIGLKTWAGTTTVDGDSFRFRIDSDPDSNYPNDFLVDGRVAGKLAVGTIGGRWDLREVRDGVDNGILSTAVTTSATSAVVVNFTAGVLSDGSLSGVFDGYYHVRNGADSYPHFELSCAASGFRWQLTLIR